MLLIVIAAAISTNSIFNKIKQCRRVATRYDKLAANYLAFIRSHQYGCGCALMSPRPRPSWLAQSLLYMRLGDCR
jgi:hypothetical protein